MGDEERRALGEEWKIDLKRTEEERKGRKGREEEIDGKEESEEGNIGKRRRGG